MCCQNNHFFPTWKPFQVTKIQLDRDNDFRLNNGKKHFLINSKIEASE